MHHDALELPIGRIVVLSSPREGQRSVACVGASSAAEARDGSENRCRLASNTNIDRKKKSVRRQMHSPPHGVSQGADTVFGWWYLRRSIKSHMDGG